uniref:NAD(P)-binding protein n=1 Tax=Phakopsora pachyrhizi TaxID=170000 RepID=A0A0S1MIA7_PHAPC
MIGYCSSQWDASHIPDLTDRVAIVTGGNTGIGYITCLELARHGAKVYMACRVQSRAEAAIEKIKQEVPDAKIEFLLFDLTILSSAKKAAQEFSSKESRLDILVNNAGIMATPYELSPDGIELQACNGTGHFALTAQLLPILKKTDSTVSDSHVRIINLSSLAHYYLRDPDFSSLEGMNKQHKSTWDRYGNSKLSNILHINELQKALQDTNIHCIAVHPGVVGTDLFRGFFKSYPFLKPLASVINFFMTPPAKGALTQLYAATSPEVETKKLKAAYLVPVCEVGKKSALAEDVDGIMGQKFWKLCEKLIEEDEQRPT